MRCNFIGCISLKHFTIHSSGVHVDTAGVCHTGSNACSLQYLNDIRTSQGSSSIYRVQLAAAEADQVAP
eukprot:5177632-Pyramimonas_sp.AAC.1